ncbi:Phospholipid scramblase 1 [Bulinus truncatus]|nr:Phospholipid scramblase 1 [Bulinus truncatus]
MPKLDQAQLDLLSVFKDLDTLIVKQQAEILEAFTHFETQNKYRAYDKIGRHVLYIAEESGCLIRQFCSSGRSYSMHVFDNNMNEVLTLQSPKRPFKGLCCFACCDLCSHQIHVFCCSQEIGYIQEVCSCRFTFVVYTAEGQPVYQIEAPYCRWDSCCCDDVFHIYRYEGDVSIAQIRKKFAGFGKEIFTDADNFGITFQKEMHTHDKALLFAATFLIDFMFYENNTQEDKSGSIGTI